MIGKLSLVFLILGCDSYKILDDWRWLELPNIFQINQRLSSSETDRSRPRQSWGRSDVVSQSDWSWSDDDNDDRDVVIHMKRNFQKNNRKSSIERLIAKIPRIS